MRLNVDADGFPGQLSPPHTTTASAHAFLTLLQ